MYPKWRRNSLKILAEKTKQKKILFKIGTLTIEYDSSGGSEHNDAQHRESNGRPPSGRLAEQSRYDQHARDNDVAWIIICIIINKYKFEHLVGIRGQSYVVR